MSRAFEHLICQQLKKELRDKAPVAQMPLKQDRWLMVSLLQKAIRRDEVRWALAATSTLMADELSWLWKRLVVIAFEDISFGDIELVATVLAMSQKPNRNEMADDWSILSHLVQRMCAAPKCRAANNLVEIGMFRPNSLETQRAFLELDFNDLFSVSLSPGEDAASRFLAAVALAFRSKEFLPHPEYDAAKYVAELKREKTDPLLQYCAEAGLKVAGLEHALAVAALFDLLSKIDPPDTLDDAMPPVDLLCGIPSYAFDMHTRAGSQAIRRFVKTSAKLQYALSDHGVRGADWFPLVRHCIFDLESGLSRKVVQHDLVEKLRTDAEHLGFGRTRKNSSAIMTAIRSDWWRYSAAKADAVKKYEMNAGRG